MVGIGIVGCGFWAKLVHIPSFQKLPGYRLVGVTSGNPENARKAAKEFNIPKAFENYKQLIADPEIQVVDICAPNYLHHPIALECFAQGKDVILIKPLATNLQEAYDIVNTAKKLGRKIYYAENVPFTPTLVRFKELIDEGLYGELFRLKAMQGVGAPHASWFSDPDLSGGGCIIDMAVHGLSFLQWFANDAKATSIYAEAGTFVHDYPVEDTSVILVRFEDGKIGQTEDSWSLTGGFDGRYEVFGTKGHGFADLLYGHPIRSALGGNEEGGANTIHYYAVDDHFIKDGHLAMMSHFLDCIVNDVPCRSDGEDGYRIMEMVDAAYQSIKSGKSIKIQSHGG